MNQIAKTPSAQRNGAERFRPQTLPEQIAGTITQAVLDGEYQPGDPLLELALSAQFDVSRGPIREALRILEKDGVVTILPQRGAHVTKLSVQEVNDIFEIRRELAPLVTQGIVPAEPALLARLDAQVDQLAWLATQPDSWDAYVQGSIEASRTLFGACRNRKLFEIFASLARQTTRYAKLGLQSPERRVQSAKGWRRMVDLLKRNQVDKAAEAMSTLIDQSRLAALKALQAAAETKEASR